MADGTKKLKKDLDIVKAMVEELTNYLYSEALYWPMFKADYPQMTLGGYLMRQRRLQILSYLLTDADQIELEQLVHQFSVVTINKNALLTKKATKELYARSTQWEGHLGEYWDSEIIEKGYYAADAQVRTKIADLISELNIDLEQLDEELLYQIDSLDDTLRANWQAGDFIWPAEWTPAYGKDEYWWLYGMPEVNTKDVS